MLIIVSCGKNDSQDEHISPTENNATEGEASELNTGEDLEIELDYEEPEQDEFEEEEIDTRVYPVQLPSSPPREYFPPALEVVPVLNIGTLYGYYIIADELTFIRRDGTKLYVFEEFLYYGVIPNRGKPVGYALNGNEFMSVTGDIVTDFSVIGVNYPDSNETSYQHRYGYLVAVNAEDNGNSRNPKKGLFDIAERRMIIEPQYDHIELLETLIYAWNDNKGYLLDYEGNLLFDLGLSNEFPDLIGLNAYRFGAFTLLKDTGELHKGGVDYIEWPPWPPNEEYMIGNVRIKEEVKDGTLMRHVRLEDANGNVLIPFGVYERLYDYSPFVRGKFHEEAGPFGSNDFDILNSKGELLVRNPLAAVWEPAFHDAMVVWLDDETCVLLEADGKQTIVENLPKVTLVGH
jgi:hypothetical protein